MTADTTLLTLEYTDDGDANGIFLQCNDNNGHMKAKIAAEGSISNTYPTEVADGALVHGLKHLSVVCDPGSFYDSDAELFIMTVGDDAPNGIIIDEWKVSFNLNPDVELNADLRYADAFIGLANAADIDEIDTTDGVSSEDTDANINGGTAIANGKVIYIGFDADPEGTGTQLIVELWFHYAD